MGQELDMQDTQGFAPKWMDFTHKICKHGSHFDFPPGKCGNMVQIVENRVQNHGTNFGKWLYSLSKS